MPLRVSCYEEEHDRIERHNKSKEIMHTIGVPSTRRQSSSKPDKPRLQLAPRALAVSTLQLTPRAAAARPARSRRPDAAFHPARCCSSPCALSLSCRCSSTRALSPSRSRSAPHRSAAAVRSRCPAATLHARRWPQETDEEHRSRTGQSRQDRRQTKGSKAANSRTSTAPAMADETEQSERGSRLAETGRGEAARSPVEPLRRRDNRRSSGRTPFPSRRHDGEMKQQERDFRFQAVTLRLGPANQRHKANGRNQSSILHPADRKFMCQQTKKYTCVV